MLAALLNGVSIGNPKHALHVEERGLNYGDGVFETMLLTNGAVALIDGHLERLRIGCERLGIATPSTQSVLGDVKTLTKTSSNGIVKLIVTRGAGGRGYRANAELAPSRITLLYPQPQTTSREVDVRWCAMRLARNAQLAGIKHLNRLEQVLAQNEWSDASIAEGLMMDTEGEVVSATASNVFVVIDGVVTTPDLRFSGVRGVMRQHVLRKTSDLGIEVSERSLRKEDILDADEIFLTNAVRGIRPVVALGERRWPVGPITQRLMNAVEART